ncbi:MAG: hypothetical protein P1U71_16065, partial [Sneathiella sp.]
MTNNLINRLTADLAAADQNGTYKKLKTIEGPISDRIRLKDAGEVTLMSSNDYLGFANHPAVVGAARAALLKYGASTASVRFICGTQDVHQIL